MKRALMSEQKEDLQESMYGVWFVRLCQVRRERLTRPFLDSNHIEVAWNHPEFGALGAM